MSARDCREGKAFSNEMSDEEIQQSLRESDCGRCLGCASRGKAAAEIYEALRAAELEATPAPEPAKPAFPETEVYVKIRSAGGCPTHVSVAAFGRRVDRALTDGATPGEVFDEMFTRLLALACGL